MGNVEIELESDDEGERNEMERYVNERWKRLQRVVEREWKGSGGNRSKRERE